MCKLSSVQIIINSLGLLVSNINLYCELLILLQASSTDHFKVILCFRYVTSSYGISKEEYVQCNFFSICMHVFRFFNTLLRAMTLVIFSVNKGFCQSEL